MKKILLILASLLLLAGCRSTEVVPFEKDDRALALLEKLKDRLPWKVAVAPVRVSQKKRDDTPHYHRLELDPVEFRESFLDRLMSHRVFTAMNPVPESANAADLAGLFKSAWDDGNDLLMTIDVRKYDVVYLGTNGNYTPNFLLWCCGLVGSYFVPDELYAVETEVRVTVYSVDSEKKLYEKTYSGRNEKSLDDFERGWMFLGYYRVPGGLSGENWEKVARVLMPEARRKLDIAVVDDYLTDFREAADSESFRKNASKTLALVIGVKNHQSTSIPDHLVAYSEKDARAFAEFLTSEEGGGLLARHVKLLVNERARLRAVVEEIWNHLIARAKPDDRVIVYFSGYGAVDPQGDPYLVTSDTNPKRLPASSMPLASLANAVARIRAEKVSLYLDTAFNAQLAERALFKGRNFNLLSMEKIVEREGAIVFAASNPSEGAFELPENEHGIFTYYLIQGLSGNADANRDGRISAKELYSYVSEKVSVEASLDGRKQSPRWYEKNGAEPSGARTEGFKEGY